MVITSLFHKSSFSCLGVIKQEKWCSRENIIKKVGPHLRIPQLVYRWCHGQSTWGPFQPFQPNLASSVGFPDSRHIMVESKEMYLKAPAKRCIKGRIYFKLLWTRNSSVTEKNDFTSCSVWLQNMVYCPERRIQVKSIWK